MGLLAVQSVCEPPTWLLTAVVVLATAAYLHHTRFLRVRAVLTAILAALFTRTIARGMLTFILFLVLRHVNTPCFTNSVVNDPIRAQGAGFT